MRITSSRRRVPLAAVIGSMLIAVATNVSYAQRPESDSARAERHSKTEASLAKQAQNPVANMVSLPLQYNYYTGGGLGTASEMVLNVQPVLPLPIGKNWLIVSRTIVPFVSIPLPLGNTALGQNPLVTPQFGGIADIEEQAYFTSTRPSKWTWAVGPIFSFPTATNRLARTGQWGLGPTAVALTMPGPWVIGTLVNNVWRIGGESNGHVLNTFTLQPFVNYNLPYAWAISTAPLITSDWSAREGQRWTVPIGLGVSKITHIVEQPLNLQLEYYHNVKHPDLGGSNQLRLSVAALWPTAAAMAEKKKEEQAARAKEKQAERKSRQGSSP
jgi:hypothetical protein